jgi:hypothetical protein
LAKDLPEFKLEVGDVGTVVMVHDDGKGFTIEFVTLTGSTVAVATVTADVLRAVRDREITHVREVA